jgi:hypothetical protein
MTNHAKTNYVCLIYNAKEDDLDFKEKKPNIEKVLFEKYKLE